MQMLFEQHPQAREPQVTIIPTVSHGQCGEVDAVQLQVLDVEQLIQLPKLLRALALQRDSSR
jgi:hypothetical protein